MSPVAIEIAHRFDRADRHESRPPSAARLPAFAISQRCSLGVELELQLIDPYTLDLTQAASDLLPVALRQRPPGEVKPEITESMIEVSSSVQQRYGPLLAELQGQRDALLKASHLLNIGVAGGGTHPFQSWAAQRIVDTPRFAQLSALYGYLAKQFTVFGQHVHIGVDNADQALWLLHALGRYIPHFIALSASSPFVQGQDTGFASARLNSVSAFPLAGRAPFVLTWQNFEAYFARMVTTGVVSSMKDFYWDIRPKPEFGTIEVRVFDTPLNIGRAAALAAYAQALANHLLQARPFEPKEDDYLVYSFNRFQACRFGLDGTWVDPLTSRHHLLRDHIALTLEQVAGQAVAHEAEPALVTIRDILRRGNDADELRRKHQERQRMEDVVAWQMACYSA